ncbi:SH3 domain-containing protein [Trichothermofontia sichuanensis B231]|uniref:SH3 domain-containing protein n=1 Tax=Trichothermofontia sichuanensis TaxID=3045816 RepID=UPI0022459DAD|nr:SH3 domain-containing protein [Trichothermofontia sichuanensis]UZQ52791.1 SH3 domain-containing protein [Trichothermofontia sichuanensis B231]
MNSVTITPVTGKTATRNITAITTDSKTASATTGSREKSTTANSQTTPPITKPYPRRPFGLADIPRPGSSFYEFRESLKRAIKERHTEYLRAIADPNIRLSFGPPMRLDDLGIDSPSSLFWKRLERVVNAPCGPRLDSPTDVYGNPQEWACPSAIEIQQIDSSPYDPFIDVFIVGDVVNVRMAPNPNSVVIGTLSYEVVKSDPQGFNQLSERQLQLLETYEGWRPIIMPSGKRGFVSSRYAFSAVGYRAFFKNEGQGWYMTVFVTGD